MTAATSRLLDEEFIARIEQLEIVSRKLVTGRLRGERMSRRRGHSTEFADHRPYAPGDDLRFLDWNIYGRLERLFLKVFLEEEDFQMSVLVDSSASMEFGEPEKFLYARKVAAALAYIALIRQDRAAVYSFGARFDAVFGPRRGRGNAPRMLHALEEWRSRRDGGTDLAAGCAEFTRQRGRSGVLVLVSDFFDRGGSEEIFRRLAATSKTTEVFVFHVLSPQEIAPALTGDLKLLDAEDGADADVTISAPLLKAYRRTLDRFRAEVKEACTRRGMHYAFASSALPFEQLILGYLKRRGLLR